MYPAELDRLVDAELRQLPSPRAPQTLLPRVMAAVEQWTRRPWYTRAWFTWPLGWQVTSVAALALIVVAGALLMPSARVAAGDAALRLAPGVLSDVAQTANRVDATMNAGRVVWRALLEPLVAYAFALVVLMVLACAAFGTALNRIAFGRT
jgi:hypothetical protein